MQRTELFFKILQAETKLYVGTPASLFHCKLAIDAFLLIILDSVIFMV